MTSTVRRSSDKGLSRLQRAMDSNQNLLSAAEIDFIQTSSRILGIDSAEAINMIGRKALERGGGQVRKVMAAITARLDTLETGWRSTGGQHRLLHSARGPMMTWTRQLAAWPTCRSAQRA
jgi:hypothetical protein